MYGRGPGGTAHWAGLIFTDNGIYQIIYGMTMWYNSTTTDAAPVTFGLIASCDGMQFTDLGLQQTSLPTPAGPWWQVYNGEFSVDSNNGARLQQADANGFWRNLAVREGFRDSDYTVDAIMGSDCYCGGLAVRVQDQDNYCAILVFGQYHTVWAMRVRNGVLTPQLLYQPVSGWGSGPLHMRVQVQGDTLNIWAYSSLWGWEQLVYSNQTLLGASGNDPALLEGGVGLCTILSGDISATASCTSLNIGYGGTVDFGALYANQTIISDTLTDTDYATILPTYDAAGNMTSDGIYRYSYDAWNRLVEVHRASPAGTIADVDRVAEYRYDGLGRRISKIVSNSGSLNKMEYYGYAGWQLLEVRDGNGDCKQQFVWGSQYIGEAICMDVANENYDCTGEGSRHFFYMQDANWNVIAMREATTSSGVTTNSIIERYEYDPYGSVRIYKGSAPPGGAESQSLTSKSLKWLNTNLPENPVLYAGYFYDAETGHYHVNHRTYQPELCCWPQRDPLGYADSCNLYSYTGNKPASATDPYGLKTRDISVGWSEWPFELAGSATVEWDAYCTGSCPNKRAFVVWKGIVSKHLFRYLGGAIPVPGPDIEIGGVDIGAEYDWVAEEYDIPVSCPWTRAGGERRVLFVRILVYEGAHAGPIPIPPGREPKYTSPSIFLDDVDCCCACSGIPI